ncbi:RNA polymerase sigma factor [Streptomyces sp. NPDC060085]|uniref:RNA polymerase sigma factor n=1 Tax=Streptomyces sp. NPDC060085 TaxID=3347054 RepID=UPI003658A4FA
MGTTVPLAVDPDGFTQLYATYRPKVENYIAARLPRRDSQLAEDLAAEVFLSLWRSRYAAGRPVEGSPWGLLATIAGRRIADHFRLARNVRETATDTGEWQFANRSMEPSTAGTYQPSATGFRTARIGGAL